MNDLLRSEWRRFRRLAVIVALAHGLALLLASRAFDVLQLRWGDQAAMLVVYMLLGLTLALVQVGSYRQRSRWLWLIHRPLAPSRIFGALALSALAMLALVVLAPLLIFLLATDTLTTQVVDSRHYVSAVHALAFAMMAWLAGAHASTSRHKAAVAVLLAPLLLALHLASVWWLLPPVLLSLAWLAFVARHSFRANRDAPITGHGVLLLTALPLQLAFFLLAFQLSKAGLALVDLLSRSAPGRTVTTRDTDVDLEAHLRRLGLAYLSAGLDASTDPRAARWREQLPLLRVAAVPADLERFPVRHQLGNVGQPWWDDKRNTQFTFSHDRMQFHGRDPQTGQSRGWWGTGGLGSPERFSEVPAFGLTRSALYAVDTDTQRQHELVRLGEREWFTGRPVQALDRLLLLTNQRLLAYQANRDAPFAPPRLDWQVALEPGEAVPNQIDVAELMDGWLVWLFYGDERELDGFEFAGSARQQVLHVDAQGRASVVADRRNIRDHHVTWGASVSVPVSSWWVSPPLYALAHAPDLLDTGLTQRPRFELLPKAPLFHALALALALASIAGGWMWLRGVPVSTTRRRLWLASCAVLGLPALLSLICLEPRGASAWSLPRFRRRAAAAVVSPCP
jgi:hypothetical protein